MRTSTTPRGCAIVRDSRDSVSPSPSVFYFGSWRRPSGFYELPPKISYPCNNRSL
jgi:hypothetical protein